MAFTVEDGTGVAGANSYSSVADADTFHSDRGNTLWTGSQSVKEQALVKATDYLEQKYREVWKGVRNNPDQALEWPRYNVPSSIPGWFMANNEIPAELKQATALLALDYIVNGDLNPNLYRGGLTRREKIDVIDIEYAPGAPGGTVRPSIDGLLRRFVRYTGLNVPVNRV